jgi:hypothetical protein
MNNRLIPTFLLALLAPLCLLAPQAARAEDVTEQERLLVSD